MEFRQFRLPTNAADERLPVCQTKVFQGLGAQGSTFAAFYASIMRITSLSSPKLFPKLSADARVSQKVGIRLEKRMAPIRFARPPLARSPL